jgi:Methyltransferase domain
VAARLTGQHPALLEYPPASIDGERWGWGRPPNAALHRLIAAQSPRYRGTLELIEAMADGLRASQRAGGPDWQQDWFTGLDAAALYAQIRTRRPARYHEVGSGYSTRFAARAIADGTLGTRILSVDPQPRADVDRLCDEVLREPLESVDPARVSALQRGDILVIDSSHYALKGSDVVAFMFDVLPALPPGVLVGLHDIFVPDDYPWWLSRWYSEQYLLGAWLLGGGAAEKIVLPAHFCATDPDLRSTVDAMWGRMGLSGLAYGSMFWFES